MIPIEVLLHRCHWQPAEAVVGASSTTSTVDITVERPIQARRPPADVSPDTPAFTTSYE